MSECIRCNECVIKAECDAIDDYYDSHEITEIQNTLIRIYDKGKADERANVLTEAIAKLNEYKSKLDPIDWIIVNQCIEYLEQLKEQE